MGKSVRILRIGDVIQKTALSQIALKEFPSQIRLGVRAAGWIENEIDHWLLDRIIKTRGTAAPGSVHCRDKRSLPRVANRAPMTRLTDNTAYTFSPTSRSTAQGPLTLPPRSPPHASPRSFKSP